MTTLTRIAALLLLALTLSACGSWKAQRAPFYVYNQSVLNEDVSPYYPRRVDPNQGVTMREVPEGDTRVAVLDSDNTDAVPAVKHAPKTRAKRSAKDKKRRHQKPKSQKPAKKNVAKKPTAPTPSKRAEKKPAPAPKPAPKPAVASKAYNPEHSAGFVNAIYKANQVDLGTFSGNDAITNLFTAVKKRGGTIYHVTRPAVGDVVFFHNTFDRNNDGRNNDWFTHAGLVEGVESDGTIHVLSYMGGKVSSFTINLEHPKFAKDERNGKIWNTPLRERTAQDPEFTRYLGGELFAGFGSVLGERQEIVVLDDWYPGAQF